MKLLQQQKTYRQVLHNIQVNFNRCSHSRWICNEKVTFFEEAKF